MSSTQVLDYSLARPAPADIAKGYVGVMRYVAPAEDAAKVITQAEYDALRAAGLQVGLNWEWYATRPREGASAGSEDAQEALRQAETLGYTGAIYFSVDFDAGVADQPAINAYFEACAAVIGLGRLGCYAGYWPLSRLFTAGLITFGWQTLAWSGGNREQMAHLYQNGTVDLGGDVNDVLKANWLGGSAMVPEGWTDDGTILTAPAPNNHPIVQGFRNWVLTHPWDPSNVPLGADYSLAQVSTVRNFGPGSRQDFSMFPLGWTQDRDVFVIPLGEEYATLKAQPAPTAKLVMDETSIRAVIA